MYGLLGTSQTEDDFFRSIVVNYEAPASDLYRRAASFVIKNRGDLDSLEHCRGQALKGLPSWVPDWSYFRKGSLLSTVLTQDQEIDTPQVEGSDAESPEDPAKRADQACITGRVAAISVNADSTPGIYKHRGSLTARIRNQYFHSVREDASPSSYSLSIKDNVLWTQAIVLDELKVVHAPFPDELQVRWEACTEFMVAVEERTNLAWPHILLPTLGSAGANTLSFVGTRKSRTHTRRRPGKRLHSGLRSLDAIFTEKTQISDQ